MNLTDWERISCPSEHQTNSDTYLMEDFYAGGLPAMLKQIESKLDLSAMTVDGQTLGKNLANAGVYDEDVIRPLDNPVYHRLLAVLRGNLAPDGAVMKPAAAESRLHKHTGPAIVFGYPK